MPEADAKQIALLHRLPGLAGLPDASLVAFAAELRPATYAAGEVVVREADFGDRLFIIESGVAEASTTGPAGSQVPLALLQSGEYFGELALLAAEGQYGETVTALAPLRVLQLPRTAFIALLHTGELVEDIWRAAATDLLHIKFLKQVATPFASLAPDAARALATHLQDRHLDAGATLFVQGDAGQECCLIRSGEVAVILDAGTPQESELARLGPGALVGEMALLSNSPRSATVRATKDCELLVLHREDLLRAVAADRSVGLRVAELFHFRDRPCRCAGIAVFEQQSAEGHVVRVLKNPAAHRYFRLAEDGWAVWQLLDGRHTLRDVMMAHFAATRQFAPAAVVHLLQQLGELGFIETRKLAGDAVPVAAPQGGRRIAAAVLRALHRQVALSGCDGWMTRLYEGGARVLFTPAALAAILLLSVAGLALFLFGLAHGEVSLTGHLPSGWPLTLLLAANLAAIALHEAGHAFTTKYYGREVDRIGVGWYWFSPIAFIDTSDMWLQGRWPRIAVDLAGIAANIACAGIASIAAAMLQRGVLAAVLWQFVVISWTIVLANLNPLLEYDGYYVLSDWLDRPNLRHQALHWLHSALPTALRQPRQLRRHWIEFCFGLGAVVYILAMALVAVAAYRAFVQPWLADWLPPPAAADMAWLPALALLCLGFTGLAVEARAVD